MADWAKYARRTRARRVATCAVALLIGSWGSIAGASSALTSSVPIATQPLASSSLCGNYQQFFQQSLNGDFTGCFLVPNFHSSTLIVALQTYLMQSAGSTNLTTTTVPAPHVGAIVLSSDKKIASPGEQVVMTGRFLSNPPSKQNRLSRATVCWDGCQTGLQEISQPVTWTSATTFRVTLSVPDTAWLSVRGGVVTAHPLTSGSYSVGVQCLTASSGCALRGPDAQSTIQLQAPAATACRAGTTCETMTLSSSSAAVGDPVFIKGWAPLQSIVTGSTSFTPYTLSVTSGSDTRAYPALSYAQEPKAGTYDVVLTPRILHVTPGPTWASLGRLAYLSSSFAGPSAVQPAATSNLIAWCPSTGLEVSAGASVIHVSTAGVATALRGTNLSLGPLVPAEPACATVLLDPAHPASVYASFSTEIDHSAPPLAFAGLYTTNDGATWHRVPAPAGLTSDDFGGFVTRGNDVEALFIEPNDAGNQEPYGTKSGLILSEVTSNGGTSWASSTLGCPSVGPCTILGPYQWGHCAMNAAPQSLLQGPAASSAASGVKWTLTSWAQSLNSCYSPQLAVTSPHGLLIVDPSSQYSLMRSTDSGTTWRSISIPLVNVRTFSTGPTPTANSLLFAPDGSLLAVMTDTSGQHEGLFRLAPGASKWCQVPDVLGAVASKGTAGPLRVSGADLVWEQTLLSETQHASSILEVKPLSTLHC